MVSATGTITKSCQSDICFQQFHDEDAGVSVGISVPANQPDSFIMDISATVGYGWAGVALGPDLSNRLMLAIWADGDKVVVSPRLTK